MTPPKPETPSEPLETEDDDPEDFCPFTFPDILDFMDADDE